MKTKYIGFCLIAASLGMVSCNDFLELDPTDRASNTIIWSTPANARMAIDNFYSDITYLGNFTTYQCTAGMTEGLTDEMKYGGMTYNALQYIPNEFSYGGLALTPNYVHVYLGAWGTPYEEIRRVNEALGYLHKAGFDKATACQYEGELRFFRALHYFDLMKRYHQAIIYGEDLTQIKVDKALGTEQEGWDYIYQDLKYAGENLPVNTSAKGRLTSGAAYAFMSRAMLYCDNWQAVKEACEKVDSMGYKLTANYADAFKDGNSEDIFQYSYDAANDISHDFDNYYAPGGDTQLDGNQADGGYGTPTQEMVEEYEKADGTRFDWKSYYEKAASGTTEAPPYDELEPRFKATILYNGAEWKKRTIEPYVGGTDGWAQWEVEAQPKGRTTTGYYLRKLVDESHSFKKLQASTQPFIAFRLAEVYLNHAEACYRLGDAAGAMKYINKVRQRVSLPAVTGLSGDQLFAAIRHERKVELAYEGLYYWDMRRWKLADKELTGIRRHGFKIEKVGDNFRYTYVPVDNKDLNFPTKLYRLPVPDAELNTNGLIEQFSEWK